MLHELTKQRPGSTWSISAENPTGEKGMGGRATEGTGAACARELGPGWKISPSIVIHPGETAILAQRTGSGAIRHIWITDSAPAGRLMVLRLYWDNAKTPAVEVPLGDFFASACYTEYHPIASLPVCVNPSRGLNSYWEMPYRSGFRMTLENLSDGDILVYYQVDGEDKPVDEDSLYFHAQFRRVNPLPYGEVHTILDNISGHGQYVGTYLHWGVKSNGWWGEGEAKFYIDGDEEFPTVCTTGTEDYFGGAYNFDVKSNYTEFITPYTGLSRVNRPDGLYNSQQQFDMYRWHIQDPVIFHENLRVTIQALGWRSEGRYQLLQDDISSVAFWYSDHLEDVYPPLPDRDGLELI